MDSAGAHANGFGLPGLQWCESGRPGGCGLARSVAQIPPHYLDLLALRLGLAVLRLINSVSSAPAGMPMMVPSET